MFAVIVIGGKQYTVAPKDVLEVEKLDAEEGKTLTFDNVLLVGSDGKTVVGTPSVKGASVTAKVLAQAKGDKLTVRRFKSKVRYRKAIGFRPRITRLEILSITAK